MRVIVYRKGERPSRYSLRRIRSASWIATKISGVPHLPRTIIDAAIFLFPTEDDARAGVAWGGSGFLVGVPSEVDTSLVHIYAVSNDHVSRLAPTIWLRRMNGEIVIHPGSERDWVEHPAGDDVAVRYLGVESAMAESIRDARVPLDGVCYFDASRLISIEDFKWGVGPSIGDECLMVGRYINHEARQFDTGIVRFGNLSMFPENIWQRQRSFEQESFLVDMRSVSGFSGSVVVVYFSQPGTLSLTSADKRPWRTLISQYWVIGVDWGHLPARHEILSEGQLTQVLVESSMAGVVPAWKVTELLYHVEEVTEQRTRAEAGIE